MTSVSPAIVLSAQLLFGASLKKPFNFETKAWNIEIAREWKLLNKQQKNLFISLASGSQHGHKEMLISDRRKRKRFNEPYECDLTLTLRQPRAHLLSSSTCANPKKYDNHRVKIRKKMSNKRIIEEGKEEEEEKGEEEEVDSHTNSCTSLMPDLFIFPAHVRNRLLVKDGIEEEVNDDHIWQKCQFLKKELRVQLAKQAMETPVDDKLLVDISKFASSESSSSSVGKGKGSGLLAGVEIANGEVNRRRQELLQNSGL